MGFNRYNKLLRSLISSSRSSTTTSPFSSIYCNQSRRSVISSSSSCSSDDAKTTHFSTISTSSYHLNNGPSYMRGAVFWEPNKPMTFEDFQMPRPKVNEVLIKTKACGVCHSDLHVIKGELPFPSPCVVGHEITGEVVEHGPLTDTKTIERLPVGARVVGAFIMPCGNCFFCTKVTRFNIVYIVPSSRKPVYMYSMGGLAEYAVVPAHALAVLPHSLPYSESAIIGCAVFTAYGAMAHAAQVRPGDAIAVIGVGGVGSSCLQIARAFGASEIIAVDIQDEKLEKAKMLGATHTVNARTEDAVAKIKEITGGMGVDTAVEALGNPKTFMQCVESVRAGGKAVMIGLTLSGAKGEIDINHLVRKQIKVVGSYGGRARHDLPKLVKLAESGIFNLGAAVSRKCKFEEAGKAYEDLNQGSILGRAVVEIM
ncbi:Alcohol dehydrogenase, C-terminal [Cynara cardunculus var. scolymus]|uniref:Alcohol dehydrogenase, C-terminal n=1 Tax=Cynara cardunculus var. scolymus TaxID=59895 RepID=A0A118K2F1_CYNCS|nr:Alcohol dehydrogenase, C-terminal [Cynara cardunculus var. scolymus]